MEPTQKEHQPEQTTTALASQKSVPEMPVCDKEDQRQCLDGTCVAKMELCPEEEMMSQDTILIMIGVGMAVVLFLIVLYCLQQRRGVPENSQPVDVEDVENPELLIPPPSYEEALNIRLYPPTPQMQRTTRMLSTEEPITPPPNYDTALHILAQSHESVLEGKNRVTSPLLRRIHSLEYVNNNSQRLALVRAGDTGASLDILNVVDCRA